MCVEIKELNESETSISFFKRYNISLIKTTILLSVMGIEFNVA